MQDIIDKWKQVGLLRNLTDPAIIRTTALALEGQRVFNKENSFSSFFKRMSIPLVRRVIPFIGIEVAQETQPIISEVTLDTNIVFEEFIGSDRQITRLDAEAEYLKSIADELAKWFSLINNRESFRFKAFGVKDNRLTVHGIEM